MTAFLNLPGPVKALLVIGGGGGLMYAIWYFGGPRVATVIYFIIGLVVISLLAYRFLLKRMDKGKSTPFLQRLKENSSAAPSAVNDPSARARLDDLRRRFEEGIQTFKDHGKDLYSVPWYALVGEPGSGKTEAIRHCNVGFPPGLQDQLQGAGGTLNMNWWFTNHAVILDTAGRLMFEDVEPGQTNEWREFLRLLRQARPNCPINGMLLVIPADSLIKDSADEITAKGGKIAEQLDAIQRELGVRFPVFVIVTKSDLINGFREFFEGLTDPVLQQQMLGWSNPDPLDAPFRPEEVEKHLESVRERLIRRRMGLLVDPTVQGEGSEGRLDDVDALYAFPESIAKIGPRLRLYLEMVFVAGEWSQKPLFLRGIYFTSSMRQGEPLDADLAEALGVEIGKLPEGGLIKPRDISYFLKDMFMDKVFRERGLVTRAANTNQVKRQRQLIGLGGGAGVILLAILLTWLGAGQLEKGIGTREAFWSEVSDALSTDPETFKLLYQDVRVGGAAYGGTTQIESIESGDDTLTSATVQVAAFEQVEDRPRTPLIFQPVALFTGNAFSQQTSAQRALYEFGVLEPVLAEVRERLNRDAAPDTWTPEATLALAELLRLESSEAGKGSKLAALDSRSPIDVRALYSYALIGVDDSGYEKFLEEHAEDLQRIADVTYRDVGSSWPPETLGAGTTTAGEAVRRGVGVFVRSWSTSGRGREGTLFGDLVRVEEAALEFSSAESRLLSQFAPSAGGGPTADDEARAFWARTMATLRKSKGELDAGIGRLIAAVGGADGSRLPDEATLASQARGAVLAEAKDQYDALLAELPPLDDLDEDDNDEALLYELREALEAGRDALESSVDARVTQVQTRLGGYRVSLLDVPARSSTGQRGYEARFAMYAAVDELIQRAAGTSAATAEAEGLAGLAAEAGEVEVRIDDAAELIERVRSDGGGIPAFDTGSVIATRGLGLASRLLRASVVVRAADLVGTRDLAAWVADRARDLRQITRPDVPESRMRGGVFEASYHPVAAKDILAAYEVLRTYSEPDADGSVSGVLNDPAVARSYEDVIDRCDRYLDAYTRYWLVDVINDASFEAPLAWPEYLEAVKSLRASTVMEELTRLGRAIEDAVSGVPVGLRAEAPRVGAFLTGIREDRDRALSPAYNDLVVATRRSLSDLSSSVPVARRTILAATPLDLEDEYLRVYRDDAVTPVEAYWSSVVLGGFNLLETLSKNEINVARQRLSEKGRGFPLCLDSDETLTAEALFDAVADIEVLSAGAGTGSGDGDRLADGNFRGLDPGIERVMRGIRGEAAGLNRRDREWIRQLSRVAALFKPDDRLRWELLVLGSPAHTDAYAVGTYRYMQARVGAQPRLMDGNLQTQSDRWLCQSDAKFQLPQSVPIRIGFSETSGQEPVAFAELDEIWGVLGVLRNADAEPLDLQPYPVEQVRGCEGVWRYDVRLVDASGEPLSAGGEPVVFSLGVRFSKPLPSLDEWPREATWP